MGGATRAALQQKRDQKRARKLRVGEPDRIQRIALLEGEDVDKTARGPRNRTFEGVASLRQRPS